MESVSGFRAQHPGCLLLLEVLDECHGSIGTGQVVAPWRRRAAQDRLSGQRKIKLTPPPKKILKSPKDCDTEMKLESATFHRNDGVRNDHKFPKFFLI